MPRYTDEIIEEVQSRNDIVDVVSQYVHLTRKGSTYFGLCPFHNEKTGSFSVSPNKQMYYCFGCGAGGSVFNFVMNYENFSFPEAVEYLADRAGVELPKQEYSPEQKREADKRSRILEINKEAAKYFYTLLRNERGKRAYEYFSKRALSDETMKKFGLGYSDQYSDDLYKYLKSKGYDDEILKESGLVTIDERRGAFDKFWNRAMFPIMDIHNKVIGFGGRVMGEGEPKYLNSPETKVFDKSRNLYGLNIARSTKKDYFLLCEGYMDVIALHQGGFDNAVASLGTALTTGHANLLKRYTKEVYLTYDSDGAGVKAALRAIPILKEVGINTKVVNMRPHKDPDEFIKNLGSEEYQKRIDNAENSFMFRVRIEESKHEMNDPSGKTEFYNEVAKMLCEFSEKLERDNYINAVAGKYMLATEDLTRLVNQTALKIGLGKEKQISQPDEAGDGEALQRPRNTVKKKEDGMKKSQKLLLTWMVENPKLFETVGKYIEAEDFTEDLYRQVAEILFNQYKETGTVNPASLAIKFSDEDSQREIAEILNARINGTESRDEKEKALKETIIRIKENSLNSLSKSLPPTDIEGLKKIIDGKKVLQNLEKMKFSIE